MTATNDVPELDDNIAIANHLPGLFDNFFDDAHIVIFHDDMQSIISSVIPPHIR